MKNQAAGTAAYGICLLLFGIAVTSASRFFTNRGNSMQPDEDFSSLGKSACEIVNVIHSEDYLRRRQRILRGSTSSSHNSNHEESRQCYDKYTYEFIITNSTEIQVYESSEETHQRPGANNNEPCHNGQQLADPTFSNSSFVECWKPAKPIAPEIRELYKCGNPSCIKIFSPGDAKKELLLVGTILSYIGTAVIGASMCTFAAAGALLMKSKNLPDQQVSPQQRYVTVGQQGGAIQMLPMKPGQQNGGIILLQPQGQQIVMQQQQPQVQVIRQFQQPSVQTHQQYAQPGIIMQPRMQSAVASQQQAQPSVYTTLQPQIQQQTQANAFVQPGIQATAASQQPGQQNIHSVNQAQTQPYVVPGIVQPLALQPMAVPAAS